MWVKFGTFSLGPNQGCFMGSSVVQYQRQAWAQVPFLRRREGAQQVVGLIKLFTLPIASWTVHSCGRFFNGNKGNKAAESEDSQSCGRGPSVYEQGHQTLKTTHFSTPEPQLSLAGHRWEQPACTYRKHSSWRVRLVTHYSHLAEFPGDASWNYEQVVGCPLQSGTCHRSDTTVLHQRSYLASKSTAVVCSTSRFTSDSTSLFKVAGKINWYTVPALSGLSTWS